MKSMMETMMPVMMKGISPEEKERLMLKMMPMMLEDIELAELLPKMMSAMLPTMLHELLEFHSKDDAHAKLLELFATVMPNVCEVIDKPKLAKKKTHFWLNLCHTIHLRKKCPNALLPVSRSCLKGSSIIFIQQLQKKIEMSLSAR